jgi:diguanylate cyclase (GGDEF)-like protein
LIHHAARLELKRREETPGRVHIERSSPGLMGRIVAALPGRDRRTASHSGGPVSRVSRMLRPSTVRVAMVGMTIVLMLLAGLSLGTSGATNRDVELVTQSSSRSGAYDAGLLALTSVEVLIHEYTVAPAPGLRSEIRLQNHGFQASMAAAAANETAPDRSEITGILTRYRTYWSNTMTVLAAVDRGDLAQAQVLHLATDPLFDEMRVTMISLSADEKKEAQQATDSLRRLRGTVVAWTAPTFGAGLLMMVVFALVIVAFRRRSEKSASDFEHQALHDILTGLPNRALFADRGERALAAAARNHATTGVMMLDLDRFKEVNDTLGHAQGDGLLQLVATRLSDSLRESDTVARLGGDEFTILLPEIGSPDAAMAVAKKLVSAFAAPFVVGGIKLDIEVSIGVSIDADGGTGIDMLLQQSDVAMYVAKDQHSRYALYTSDLDSHSPRTLSLLGELRRALDAGDLVLHFQPKADMATAEVVGVEALVRWEHRTLGLIPPAEFVPLAERTGLIYPLTEFVMSGALRQCRDWLDSGIKMPVAVNISARNLLDEGFPALVAGLLQHWKVPSAMLVLEITENSVMTDPAGARKCLLELTDLGVALSIDDFGTGYSSLAYIKDLPVRELKIDRSFTTALDEDGANRMIVNSIVSLGQNFGLRVVAEGVEDKEAWRQLAALGCDCAQGYFLARPMPGAEVAAWREAWRVGHNVEGWAGPDRAIA